MKNGKFDIDVIDTGIFALDGGAMFGVVPKALWSKAYNPGDELNRIPLAARLILLRWDGHIALVDTSNGNKLPEKIKKIYGIDEEKSTPDNYLRQFGLKREDITDVILTHLHFDHAGGATVMNNGKPEPAFPNAKYYVQKDQLDWAKNPTEKDRASFFPENFLPLEAEGMLELTDGDGELFPGVEMITIHGHTKAQQLVKISDKGGTVLFMADLCPTAAHIKPAYGMGYDNYPLTAMEEKKRILPQAMEEGWTLIFEHDAFIQAAKIKNTEKGFAIAEEVRMS